MRRKVIVPIIEGSVITLLFLVVEIILLYLGAFNENVRLYVVDISLRILFGTLTLILIHICYRKGRSDDSVKKYLTNKIPKTTWLMLIPFIAYLLMQFLKIAFSVKSYNPGYMWYLCIGQQIGTGYYEEAIRALIMCGMLKFMMDGKFSRIKVILIAGALFGLSHGLNFFFSGSILSTLLSVVSCFFWGMYMAAIFMHSRNLTLIMVMHAVWDTVVRIPGWFFVFPENSVALDVIDTAEYVFSYGIFTVVAIVIAVRYKRERVVEYPLVEQ